MKRRTRTKKNRVTYEPKYVAPTRYESTSRNYRLGINSSNTNKAKRAAMERKLRFKAAQLGLDPLDKESINYVKSLENTKLSNIKRTVVNTSYRTNNFKSRFEKLKSGSLNNVQYNGNKNSTNTRKNYRK